MQLRSLSAVIVITALSSVVAAQAASAPCFEPNFGTLVGTGDDLVFPANQLGFTFNYAGSAYTDIVISSNGFVYLGNGTNQGARCCNGTGAAFVANAPSIAPLWTDLVSNTNGGFYFNALPNRAVVTWRDCREFGTTGSFTVQMQMTSLGEVTFWYSPGLAITIHTTVAGITPGNAANNPGSIDLSASFPYNSNAEPTVYEEWAANAFDLAGSTWELIQNGSNGFLALARTGCAFVAGSFTPYGNGCPPQSRSGFEMIPTGNGYTVVPASGASWFSSYTNATNITDDQTIPVALPFSFPHPGGSTSNVGLCSNGFLHLTASTASPFTCTVADYLSGPARIFGCWTDWYRPGAGQVYSDQITPTSWAFTWDRVAEFANATPGGTWQMQIDSTGRVTVLYESIVIATHDILIGYSRGGSVPDPGNTDLSVSMPFVTGNPNPEFREFFTPGSAFDLNPPAGGVPLVLRQDSGNSVIGTSYRLRLSQVAGSAVAAFLVLGFNQLSVALDPLGMTGCTQYVSLDSALFFPPASPTMVFTLGLPNRTSLIGYTVFSQAAVFAPGVNPLGVAASNGGQILLGTY